ncbi:cyclic nucleotide-gated ion channel 16 family protein, partial [Capsicum annuum]
KKKNEKSKEKSKGHFIQNPNCDIHSLPLHTSERTFLIEINALSHLFNPKWLGREKVPFFEGTAGNRSSGDGVGPVAQRIRARGYEPRCRGFESLLAHNRPKREVPFPLGIGKS